MVCVGYINLLKDLLDKLNINSTMLHIKVSDLNYEEENKDIEKNGHSRILVNLNDKKYGINGYYMGDPTWDNDLNLDFYNHLLFTGRKNDYCIIYQWLDENILFNVNSLHEFNRYFDFLRERYNKSGIELLNFIINTIKELDFDYLEELKNKYKIIDNYYYNIYEHNMNYKQLLKLKNELGEYIISKANKDINFIEIKKAIRYIYKKFYGFNNIDEMNNYLDDVFEYNKLRDEVAFLDENIIDKYNNKKFIKKL